MTRTRSIAAALLVAAFLSASAGAATFVVDRFDDSATIFDACTAAPGDCSLRGAILRANQFAAADVVRLGSGLHALTRTGAGEDAATTGDLDLTRPVHLVGAGPSATGITASGLGERVFEIHAGADGSVLEGLAISSAQAASGAGVRCIAGNLALRGVRISSNLASNRGAGIEVLSDCWVTGLGLELATNIAGDEGGGAYVEGVFEVFRGKVRSNSAQLGGGVSSRGGFVHFYGVQLSANQATSGGAVFAGRGTAATGFLLLEDSTVAANQADNGSGLRVSQVGAQIRHATFGVQLGGDQRALMVSGTASFPAAVHVWNSIFDAPCLLLSGDAAIVSNGGNLEVETAICELDHPSDQQSVPAAQAELLPFGDYGGDTWTVGLGAASVARDAAPASCTDFDQRRARRSAAPCDAGAYEVAPGFLFADDFESGGPWFWSGVAG